MKVALITRHNIFNYGSLLQTFALQKFLINNGINCEVINYVPCDEKVMKLANTLYKSTRKSDHLYQFIYYLLKTPSLVLQNILFSRFKKKLLIISKLKFSDKSKIDFDLLDADILCAGSDQLWGRIGLNEYDPNYFFNYYSGDKRLISYGSSFGTENVSDAYKNELPILLRHYKKISVRETSAKKILDDVNIPNVEVVLDPVFLLFDYRKDFAKDIRMRNYVLLYQLHQNKDAKLQVMKIAKKLGYTVVNITPSVFNLNPGCKNILLPSPNKFLGYIKNASFVFTDSFHATVFSIIFNKNFYIMPLLNKTYTRINCLLNLFGIKKRELINFNPDNSIEYDRISSLIKKNVEFSRDFLLKEIYDN